VGPKNKAHFALYVLAYLFLDCLTPRKGLDRALDILYVAELRGGQMTSANNIDSSCRVLATWRR